MILKQSVQQWNENYSKGENNLKDKAYEIYKKHEERYMIVTSLFYELKDIEDTDDDEIKTSRLYLMLQQEKDMLEEFMFDLEKIFIGKFK